MVWCRNGASVFLGLTRILIRPPEDLEHGRLRKSPGKFSMNEHGALVQGLKGRNVPARAMRQALLKAYDDAPDRIAAQRRCFEISASAGLERSQEIDDIVGPGAVFADSARP